MRDDNRKLPKPLKGEHKKLVRLAEKRSHERFAQAYKKLAQAGG